MSATVPMLMTGLAFTAGLKAVAGLSPDEAKEKLESMFPGNEVVVQCGDQAHYVRVGEYFAEMTGSIRDGLVARFGQVLSHVRITNAIAK
jgi:hypothetical protein